MGRGVLVECCNQTHGFLSRSFRVGASGVGAEGVGAISSFLCMGLSQQVLHWAGRLLVVLSQGRSEANFSANFSVNCESAQAESAHSHFSCLHPSLHYKPLVCGIRRNMY